MNEYNEIEHELEKITRSINRLVLLIRRLEHDSGKRDRPARQKNAGRITLEVD